MYEWLRWASNVAVVPLVLLFLVSISSRARPMAGAGIVWLSWLFGAQLWVFSVMQLDAIWGGFSVFLGILLGGVGVVPMLALALAIHRAWGAAAILIGWLAAVYAIRLAGLRLSKSGLAPRSSPSPPAAHEKEVDAVARIVLNIMEDTTVPGMAASKGGNAPTVLNFQLPDSKLRYLMFCLSIVLTRCAHRIEDTDALLNEVANKMIPSAVALKGSDGFIAENIDPRKASFDAGVCLRAFLDRWTVAAPKLFEMISPTGVPIDESSGDAEGGMRLVCAMLHDTESLAPITKEDEARLWPLACWITAQMEPMGLIDGSFVQLVH